MNKTFNELGPEQKKRLIKHFEQTDSEYKTLRDKIIKTAEKKYEDTNKLEIIILTGTFGLVINFFTRPEKEFIFPIHLVTGLTFITGAIILKSLIYRISANRLAKEVSQIDEQHENGSKLIFQDITKEEYQDNSKKITKKYARYFKIYGLIGEWLNNIEFALFTIGIISVLIFFFYNI